MRRSFHDFITKKLNMTSITITMHYILLSVVEMELKEIGLKVGRWGHNHWQRIGPDGEETLWRTYASLGSQGTEEEDTFLSGTGDATKTDSLTTA